jgi:ABC-2 type transport system permease protein
VSVQPGFDRSDRSHVPLSVLMEGKFRSFFEGRIPPKIRQSEEIGFRTRSKDTRMIVVGDGDVIRNEVRNNGQVLPLGYEKYSRRRNKVIYGNKQFLMNGLDYLFTESEQAVLRGGVTLRKLDPNKIQGENRYYWQVVNVAVPIALIILFGAARRAIRIRRYAKSN